MSIRNVASKAKASKSKASKTRKAGPSSSSLQNKITSTFLCMLNTIKIYHWNTDHYATHKATDQLYGDLNEKIDTFVETMLGKESVSTRHKVLKINSLKMSTYKSNKDFRKETESYKSFLIGLTNNKLFNTPQNSDLMNMRDDILASLNQFLYLLTLH
jgi:DNA-binding ferritin-like protein